MTLKRRFKLRPGGPRSSFRHDYGPELTAEEAEKKMEVRGTECPSRFAYCTIHARLSVCCLSPGGKIGSLLEALVQET